MVKQFARSYTAGEHFFVIARRPKADEAISCHLYALYSRGFLTCTAPAVCVQVQVSGVPHPRNDMKIDFMG